MIPKARHRYYSLKAQKNKKEQGILEAEEQNLKTRKFWDQELKRNLDNRFDCGDIDEKINLEKIHLGKLRKQLEVDLSKIQQEANQSNVLPSVLSLSMRRHSKLISNTQRSISIRDSLGALTLPPLAGATPRYADEYVPNYEHIQKLIDKQKQKKILRRQSKIESRNTDGSPNSKSSYGLTQKPTLEIILFEIH